MAKKDPKKPNRLTREELEELGGDVLPERAAMSVIGNLVRVDTSLAAQVIPDDPEHYGGPDEAEQTVTPDQP